MHGKNFFPIFLKRHRQYIYFAILLWSICQTHFVTTDLHGFVKNMRQEKLLESFVLQQKNFDKIGN